MIDFPFSSWIIGFLVVILAICIFSWTVMLIRKIKESLLNALPSVNFDMDEHV